MASVGKVEWTPMASVGKEEGVNSHGKCRQRGVNSHGKCRQRGVNYHGKCGQNRVNVFASHRMSHFSSFSVWLQARLKCTLFPDCSAGLVLVVVLCRISNISLFACCRSASATHVTPLAWPARSAPVCMLYPKTLWRSSQKCCWRCLPVWWCGTCQRATSPRVWKLRTATNSSSLWTFWVGIMALTNGLDLVWPCGQDDLEDYGIFWLLWLWEWHWCRRYETTVGQVRDVQEEGEFEILSHHKSTFLFVSDHQ